MTAASRARAETAMVERDQARAGQPLGVPAGDLLADGAGPGAPRGEMAGPADLRVAGRAAAPPALRRRLPGITQKVLTETLRAMAADGLVERRVLKEEPPQHVEYALTPLGRTLEEPLAAVCGWASSQVPA